MKLRDHRIKLIKFKFWICDSVSRHTDELQKQREKEEEDRNFVVATQIETQHVVTSRNRTQVPAAGDGQGLAALKAKIQKLEADLSKKNEYITFLNKKHRDLVQRFVK